MSIHAPPTPLTIMYIVAVIIGWLLLIIAGHRGSLSLAQLKAPNYLTITVLIYCIVVYVAVPIAFLLANAVHYVKTVCGRDVDETSPLSDVYGQL